MLNVSIDELKAFDALKQTINAFLQSIHTVKPKKYHDDLVRMRDIERAHTFTWFAYVNSAT